MARRFHFDDYLVVDECLRITSPRWVARECLGNYIPTGIYSNVVEQPVGPRQDHPDPAGTVRPVAIGELAREKGSALSRLVHTRVST